MKQPHILYIGNEQSIHLQRWIAYFTKKDVQISLASDGLPAHDLIAPSSHIQLINLKKNSRLSTLIELRQNIRIIKQALTQRHCDLIHCHFTNRYGWLGWRSGFHPIIQTIWGSDLMANHGFVQNTFNKYSWKGADITTVHSQYMERYLKRRLAGHAHNIRLIRWGIDDPIIPDEPLNRQIKESLGLNKGQIIFCPRSFRAVYNIATIIKALGIVIKSVPTATLVISKHNADNGYLHAMKALINELKINDNVRIIDAVDHEKMPAYYQLSQVVVSVSRSEGFPISILEAMSYRTPVILGRIAQLDELENKNCAVFVEPTDHDALAEAMVRLLKNPETVQPMIKRAYQTAQQWNFNRAMENFYHLYFELAQ